MYDHNQDLIGLRLLPLCCCTFVSVDDFDGWNKCATGTCQATNNDAEDKKVEYLREVKSSQNSLPCFCRDSGMIGTGSGSGGT
jgi:hypothetical protein